MNVKDNASIVHLLFHQMEPFSPTMKSGWELGGRKFICSQGRKIIFNLYTLMKIKTGPEIENPCRTDTDPSEGICYC
jgi:hypothetical protein